MNDGILLTGFFTPNAYIDRAMQHLLPQEFVVLSFAARHILGWRDKINERAAPISLEMFEHGFAYTDADTGQERRFGGCGLGRSAISKCLQSLETFGLIERAGYVQDRGQMWRLGQWPKWDLLEQRTAARAESNRKRTTKARANKGRIVAQYTEGEIASNDDVNQGGRIVAQYIEGRIDESAEGGRIVAQYDGRIVGQTESNTSTNTSLKDCIAQNGDAHATASQSQANPDGEHPPSHTLMPSFAVETTPAPAAEKPRAERPRNEWYDAIFRVWGYTAGRNADLQKMLRGTATKKGHKEYNLEQPLESPTEIDAWWDWYVHVKRRGLPDVRPLEKLASLQSSFGEWRAYQKAQTATAGRMSDLERQREARRRYEAEEQARIAALAGEAA